MGEGLGVLLKRFRVYVPAELIPTMWGLSFMISCLGVVFIFGVGRFTMFCV